MGTQEVPVHASWTPYRYAKHGVEKQAQEADAQLLSAGIVEVSEAIAAVQDGRLKAAVPLLERAEDICHHAMGEHSPISVAASRRLASVYAQRGAQSNDQLQVISLMCFVLFSFSSRADTTTKMETKSNTQMKYFEVGR